MNHIAPTSQTQLMVIGLEILVKNVKSNTTIVHLVQFLVQSIPLQVKFVQEMVGVLKENVTAIVKQQWIFAVLLATFLPLRAHNKIQVTALVVDVIFVQIMEDGEKVVIKRVLAICNVLVTVDVTKDLMELVNVLALMDMLELLVVHNVQSLLTT